MKKRIILVILALVCAASALGVFAISVEKPESYIWILEARGESKTVLKSLRTSGITANYDFNMRYVSLSGDTLTESDVPTRFTGAATLDVTYDYSTVPKIQNAIFEMDSVVPDSLLSFASCRTQSELANFELGLDGGISSRLEISSVETNLGDTEYVINALGSYHSGAAPGITIEGGVNEIASVYINADSKEFEIGKGTDYGVRSVAVLVTVRTSQYEEDTYSFELAGTLKRVVYSPENLYGMLMSPSAKPLPVISTFGEDELESLNIGSALSRLKAFYTGGVYWPVDLPATLPEFDEANRITEVTSANGVVYVKATSSWAQYNKYRQRLLSQEGYYTNGIDIYSKDCYIKFVTETHTRENVDVTLEIYLPAKNSWLEGFEIFPTFKYGTILKTPSGEGVPKTDESAWMNVLVYGADEASFVSYGKELEEKGFEYDLDEYIFTSKDGYRYSFSMADFTDEFGSGKLLTFYISKAVTEKDPAANVESKEEEQK